MGQSAGAQIAALVAYDDRYLMKQRLTPAILAGYIGLSGPYDFELDSKLLRATFGGSAERAHDAQPVNFVARDSPRTLLAMGRDDKTVRPRNATSLAAHLRDAGAEVEEVWVPGTHGVTVGTFARTDRGDSIGVIANRHESLFLPANWVFSIWSLIYLGLIASAVYEALPTPGASRAVERIGPWWVVASVLNVAWITFFSFRYFGTALLVMMMIVLVSLVMTTARLRAPSPPSPPVLPRRAR